MGAIQGSASTEGVDIRAWPTRADVAKRLAVSESWVRRRERSRALHPVKDAAGVHRFDPAEIATFAMRERKRRVHKGIEDRGVVAKVVFDRFVEADGRGALRAPATKIAIVRELEIAPDVVEDLFAHFVRGLGAPVPALPVRPSAVDSRAADDEHARMVRELEEERQRRDAEDERRRAARRKRESA